MVSCAIGDRGSRERDRKGRRRWPRKGRSTLEQSPSARMKLTRIGGGVAKGARDGPARAERRARSLRAEMKKARNAPT